MYHLIYRFKYLLDIHWSLAYLPVAKNNSYSYHANTYQEAWNIINAVLLLQHATATVNFQIPIFPDQL